MLDYLGCWFKVLCFRLETLQRFFILFFPCHRRAGNYHRALETYKTVHRKFPENIECLKFLVKLSSDMGLKEAGEYAMELKKAEK